MTNIFLHTTSIIPLFQKICRIKEPLFCAKDVATALGYSDTADAIQRHCKSGKKVFCPHGNGMDGTNMVYIPEKDVYRLIMRSNLPNAEQFQDWVCDEAVSYTHLTLPTNSRV